MNNKKFSLKEVLIIMLVSALLVGFFGSYTVYRHFNGKSGGFNCQGLSSDPFITEFISRYQEIIDNYYEDIDKAKLLDSALSGMLSYLGDPYTGYLNEDEANSLLEQLEGEYTGLGVEVSHGDDGGIYIMKVFADTPAMEAGLKVGDKFLRVNGESTEGKSVTEVVNEIKNGNRNTIDLAILRENIVKEFVIERRKLFIPSVEVEVIKNNIGYMKISTFSNTTAEQVRKAIGQLQESGVNKLIVDLRNNTGGYLHSAHDIIEQFLKKGEVMYKIQYKDEIDVVMSEKDSHVEMEIIVLVNNGSASASEILAGALKDTYGAKLVGTTTYGKGKIQQTNNTSSGGMIKYTSAYWLTPSGFCVDGKGLSVDYEVTMDEAYYDGYERKNDNQFQKALEIISK